jgi:hypothetical protein
MSLFQNVSSVHIKILEIRICEFGFKVSKSAYMTLNFVFTKLDSRYQNSSEFYADSETAEKKAKKNAH